MIITIEITANVSPVQIKGVRGHRSHLWKGTPIIVQRDSNSLGAVNRKKKMENHPIACVWRSAKALLEK
jgi:hypothetical protein